MFKLERHKHFLARIVQTVHHRLTIHQTAAAVHSLHPVVAGGARPNVDALVSRQPKTVAAEYAAMLRLLSRSTGLPTSLVARQLHTSYTQFARGAKSSKTPRKKDELEKAPPPQPDPPKKNDDDKDDDDDKKSEKVMSLLTKGVMWMATIYILTLVLAMVLPRKNQPETSTR